MITGLIIPGFSHLCTDGIERSGQSRDSLTPEIWGGICRYGIQINSNSFPSCHKELKRQHRGPCEMDFRDSVLLSAVDTTDQHPSVVESKEQWQSCTERQTESKAWWDVNSWTVQLRLRVPRPGLTGFHSTQHWAGNSQTWSLEIKKFGFDITL